ncbi:MAG: glycosyltransferase family A protein [Bacteroidales bacterium]|nr:glycosyltransferase family A protein [Bacteroidales bacterium]
MMREAESLPVLLECLRRQSCQDFTLYACVNHSERAPQEMVDDNRQCLSMLATCGKLGDAPPVLLSRVWQGKRGGVGWARKVLFQEILSRVGDDELIVSLDADTVFAPTHFAVLLEECNLHPSASAFALPYYHPLPGDEETCRTILRYELYMRHYCLSLRRIGSPYAFTALGSAMAFPVWAYKKVGGITPLQGGEDFYLMQKFVKTGLLCHPARLCVYPSPRPSLRVPFGTGPAVASGLAALEVRHPFFPQEAYEAIKATYDLFPALYGHDLETPMSSFLRRQLGTDDPWGPLRRNFRSQEAFVRACHERVDGLRILQYLRTFPYDADAFGALFPLLGLPKPETLDFATAPIGRLDELRNQLFRCENAPKTPNEQTYRQR